MHTLRGVRLVRELLQAKISYYRRISLLASKHRNTATLAASHNLPSRFDKLSDAHHSTARPHPSSSGLVEVLLSGTNLA